MGWILAGMLALISFAAMVLLFKLPRKAWEACGAAMVLGLAGYALQGSPDMSAAPKEAAEKVAGPEAAAAVKAQLIAQGNSK